MRVISHILLFALLFGAFSLQAQERASFRQQSLADLPIKMRSIFVLDGHLFCYADNLLFEARFSAGSMVALSADTMLYGFDKEADYAVRNPRTGNLFFTRPDSRGRHALYEVVPREGKSPKVRKVRLGRRLSIDHPVFSSDGSVLVFSSVPTEGYGGSDLFYCLLNEKDDWTDPRSMGTLINSVGDEANPVIFDDFLYFSFRDTLQSSQWHIRAARLLQPRGTEAMPSRPVVGGCAPIVLPLPYNATYGGTSHIAFDTVSNRIFLLSTRNGGQSVFLYDGTMPTVVLHGVVTDVTARPLSNVNVSVFKDDKLLCRGNSDENGNYRFLLGYGDTYNLWMSKAGYFGNTVEVFAVNDDANTAVADLENNVTLDNLELGKYIYLFDLFGPDASVELSAQGKQKLQRMVRFLYENPQIRVSIGVSSIVSADNEFNNLVTDRRIDNLQHYLSSLLPQTSMDFYIAPTGVSGNVSDYNSRLSIRME